MQREKFYVGQVGIYIIAFRFIQKYKHLYENIGNTV